MIAANANYTAPDNLSAVPLQGAKIDLAGWKFRKRISRPKPGVQQVELDPDVLAHGLPDQRDVRIVEDDRQLPFLLERTSISRPVVLGATQVQEAKRPQLSRWSLKLPQAGIPITRIVCSAGSALFQREMRLWENVADDRGNTFPSELGRARWQRLPNQPASELVMSLDATPRSDTLFLETDNGDNPPIELRDFRGSYPVTRVIFKGGPDPANPIWLYYGNAEAAPARYDVSLIAEQLLRAQRESATPGTEESTGEATGRIAQSLSGSARYIFWGALALVVVALLFLIARLLPKTE